MERIDKNENSPVVIDEDLFEIYTKAEIEIDIKFESLKDKIEDVKKRIKVMFMAEIQRLNETNLYMKESQINLERLDNPDIAPEVLIEQTKDLKQQITGFLNSVESLEKQIASFNRLEVSQLIKLKHDEITSNFKIKSTKELLKTPKGGEASKKK